MDFSEPDQVALFFDKRKNDQFREGSSVVIPRVPDSALDLPGLFLQWQDRSPAPRDSDFVFLDFPFTSTAGCLDAEVHETKAITYGKYRKALSQWMAPYVGKLNAQAFLSSFGTKSGRSGGASPPQLATQGCLQRCGRSKVAGRLTSVSATCSARRQPNKPSAAPL